MQSIPALMAVVNTNKTVTETTEKISRMQDVYVKGKGIADGIFFFFFQNSSPAKLEGDNALEWSF